MIRTSDSVAITASDFGMPSPGHTTLTKASGGNDSFFDIAYCIDFMGAGRSPECPAAPAPPAFACRSAEPAVFDPHGAAS